MEKSNIIKKWKNPINQTQGFGIENPVGDIFEEISEDDLHIAGGEGVDNRSLILNPGDLSKLLGNNGMFCTYTKECTYACNL
ncbi:plantaricin C family lantibiotic [Bacillus paramycoides]|uniref:plantaricin C family lantibiotic n=1 Tax=Bacillus paramycoides TaxID=2026194 RepID=UPI003183DEF6